MQSVLNLTKQDMILVAARGLGVDIFTAESLVVEAWKANPKAFGLKTYSGMYPDSNLVLAYLMGKNGLVAQGFLERVAPKTYRLTEKGRDRSEGLG